MAEEIIKLNLESEICPYTLIMALEKTKEIESDIKAGKKILEISIDHPPAVDNFPEEYKSRGYKTEIKKINQGKWIIKIKY